MKKKIIFILACLSLLSINGLLMSISHAQDDESEIIQADSYFNDDAASAQPLMYDDNGNVINPVATNGLPGNPINDQLDEVDRGANEMGFSDEVNTDANTDSELVSGSAPIYNQ